MSGYDNYQEEEIRKINLVHEKSHLWEYISKQVSSTQFRFPYVALMAHLIHAQDLETPVRPPNFLPRRFKRSTKVEYATHAM